MDKNTLLHYGVPGMRWGVRKKRYDDSEETRRRYAKEDNPEDEPHADYQRTVSRQSLKSMSTQEIQAMNNRIQAERQYKELTMTKGERLQRSIKNFFVDIGKQSAKRFVNHYAQAGVDKFTSVIDQKTGLDKLLDFKGTKEKNKKEKERKLDEEDD